MGADHIIIGSGINALVAAALLSRKGKKVTLLERSDRAGGCMRTEEVTLPGFSHDVMAATFVLFLTSPAYTELAGDLAKHGLEFCHSPHPTGVIRPDGSALVLGMDRAKNIATFDALAHGDGRTHGHVVSAIEAEAPFLFSLLGGNLWSWRTVKLLLGQARRRGPKGLAAWFGQGLAPARGWLESDFRSPLTQALFAPWVLHCGLTPESTYSAKMAQVVAFALEAAGAPIVKGGAGAAAEAFVRLIKANGGEVHLNADVERILTANARVKGVRLTTGQEFHAPSVLASVTPDQLYNRLLGTEDLPEERIATHNFRHGRGDMQIHYALDQAPEWLTEGMEDVALIHLSDGIDAVSKSANEAERGMLPAEPTICVGQPSRLDPSRAPAGKATLWLQIPDAPRQIKGDAKGEITGTSWTPELREAFADRIEAILARHIRNFDRIKLARRSYSPADLEALNMNLLGGDPYGGACSIDQFFLWRPFVHSASGPKIKGLTHIGASTHPGPGLGGGSGYLAAKGLGA